MQLAYSTLACPEWSWSESIAAAERFGYDGIEWRMVDGEFVLPDFSPVTARAIGASVADHGLAVCALDSGISLACPPSGDRESRIGELVAMVRLAEAMRAPRLRVFSGEYPESVSDGEAAGWVRDVLAGAAPAARDCGVDIVIEIHPLFPWDRKGLRGTTSSAFAAEVLDGGAAPHARIQWDVGNPYYEGETPEQTWRNVRPHLSYLHMKDMRPRDGGWQYVPMGEGVLPIDDILGWLRQDGFDGWLSFEWEKRWVPELAPPEIALPQYVDYMRPRLSAVGANGDADLPGPPRPERP